MSEPKKVILHLHLKGEYWDAIKAGSKTEENRLTSKWLDKLIARPWEEIWLYRGYPPKSSTELVLKRKWNGFVIKQITHPHFGNFPVSVCAIDVTNLL